MNKKTTRKQKSYKNLPWYKYPWVWFMISLPATAVVAGVFTIYIAHKHAPQIIIKQNKFQIGND